MIINSLAVCRPCHEFSEAVCLLWVAERMGAVIINERKCKHFLVGQGRTGGSSDKS